MSICGTLFLYFFRTWYSPNKTVDLLNTGVSGVFIYFGVFGLFCWSGRYTRAVNPSTLPVE